MSMHRESEWQVHVVDVRPEVALCLRFSVDNWRSTIPDRMRVGWEKRRGTVLRDGRGRAVFEWPVANVVGKELVTLRGWRLPGNPDPVQKAVHRGAKTSSGYCRNGWVLTAKSTVAKMLLRPTTQCAVAV